MQGNYLEVNGSVYKTVICKNWIKLKICIYNVLCHILITMDMWA